MWRPALEMVRSISARRGHSARLLLAVLICLAQIASARPLCGSVWKSGACVCCGSRSISLVGDDDQESSPIRTCCRARLKRAVASDPASSESAEAKQAHGCPLSRPSHSAPCGCLKRIPPSAIVNSGTLISRTGIWSPLWVSQPELISVSRSSHLRPILGSTGDGLGISGPALLARLCVWVI
jgi:hypothetical protein